MEGTFGREANDPENVVGVPAVALGAMADRPVRYTGVGGCMPY